MPWRLVSIAFYGYQKKALLLNQVVLMVAMGIIFS
jgi:hypothetical protein